MTPEIQDAINHGVQNAALMVANIMLGTTAIAGSYYIGKMTIKKIFRAVLYKLC